jgi:hypothetical protein
MKRKRFRSPTENVMDVLVGILLYSAILGFILLIFFPFLRPVKEIKKNRYRRARRNE